MRHIAICCGNRLLIVSSLYIDSGRTYKHMSNILYPISPRTLLGLSGNELNCRDVLELVRFRKEMYETNENREMVPEVIAAVILTFLHEQRFDPYNVEAMVISLHPNSSKPYLCKIDSIGGIKVRNDLVSIGGLNEVQKSNLCNVHRKSTDIIKATSEVTISWQREIIKNNIETLTKNKKYDLANIIREINYGVTLNIIESDEIIKIDIYEKKRR